jgi:predicted membrane channel-forming protein YqfA (hemolysin III family)
MTAMDSAPFRRRVAWLIAIVLTPLVYLMFLQGPIAQPNDYHIFADARTCQGIRSFGNVASNLLFLLAGTAGLVWCQRNLKLGARRSWMVFFAGVALVFFGSAYYHTTPNHGTLVWDRLPMTLAFMGLLIALLSEHLGESFEQRLLLPALVLGVFSVVWWRYSGDLRVYIWVQAAPLLAIPFVLVMFPARHTHRLYLVAGLAFYALAKVAELYDREVFDLTGFALSGHSLKHLLAAIAPCSLLLMLRRRTSIL